MRIGHREAKVGSRREGSTGATPEEAARVGARLSGEHVWRTIAKASFAVLGYVTPSGEPRSSGVMYRTLNRRLYVVVGTESWKARHIPASGRVAVTVPVRRGGLLSLVAPIPPATISFHAAAAVHPADSPEVGAIVKRMASVLPEERRSSSTIIEIVPEGWFATYGIGVPLMKMRDPTASRARVAVAQ
jgi:hypothetical protein